MLFVCNVEKLTLLQKVFIETVHTYLVFGKFQGGLCCLHLSLLFSNWVTRPYASKKASSQNFSCSSLYFEARYDDDVRERVK